MSEGFYKDSIRLSEDLKRIIGLPRRSWSDKEAKELAREMTQVLKTPKGQESLWPIQAIALYELGTHGGLFGSMPVGTGKTLTSLLAPYVLEARKPVLALPAMLVEKTNRERIRLSAHWRIPLNIRLISLESLGRVNQADTLDVYQPDLVIVDEAHRIKNRKAAVTRRFVRYMKAHPETKFAALSGTMVKHGLADYEHLLKYCLKQGAPIPFDEGELSKWEEVLDERLAMCRIDPGALLSLCNEEERKEPKFRAARLGYQRRLMETPAVVSSKGAEVACSVYINSVTYPVNPLTEENFKKLRTSWLTPDGWPLMQAVDVWRHARELALGFTYIWSPRPPKEWMRRRALWAKFVRKTLAYSRHLDSPLQVELAVKAGEIEDSIDVEEDGDWREESNLLDRWKEIEGSFKPKTEAVWHDTSALEFCEAWGNKHKGIVWTDHSLFAHELARRTGWDYFGREGTNAAGVPIDLAKASHEGKTIIASRKSNGTGRNLQAWNRSLILSLPGGADELEQLIARTHRPGQLADEVVVDIVFACAEHLKAWADAKAGAEMTRDTLGQQQKILIADLSLDTDSMSRYNSTRWSRTVSEKEAGFVLPTF